MHATCYKALLPQSGNKHHLHLFPLVQSLAVQIFVKTEQRGQAENYTL